MKEREMTLAERYGIAEKCQRLEQSIMSISGATSVEYDLSGFLDGIHQVIVLVGYDYSRVSFWNLTCKVARIALEHDLKASGDRVEDYGEHAYFVFDCGDSWTGIPQSRKATVKELVEQYEAKVKVLDRKISSLRTEGKMFCERAQELRRHADRAEQKADAVHKALDELYRLVQREQNGERLPRKNPTDTSHYMKKFMSLAETFRSASKFRREHEKKADKGDGAAVAPRGGRLGDRTQRAVQV